MVHRLNVELSQYRFKPMSRREVWQLLPYLCLCRVELSYVWSLQLKVKQLFVCHYTNILNTTKWRDQMVVMPELLRQRALPIWTNLTKVPCHVFFWRSVDPWVDLIPCLEGEEFGRGRQNQGGTFNRTESSPTRSDRMFYPLLSLLQRRGGKMEEIKGGSAVRSWWHKISLSLCWLKIFY